MKSVTQSNCAVCSSLNHYSMDDFGAPSLNWTCSFDIWCHNEVILVFSLISKRAWKVVNITAVWHHNNIKFLFHVIFRAQWSNISLLTEFQLNIFLNDWITKRFHFLLKDFTFLWSQILQGTFCNFVAMVTALTAMNWHDLQNVS